MEITIKFEKLFSGNFAANIQNTDNLVTFKKKKE